MRIIMAMAFAIAPGCRPALPSLCQIFLFFSITVQACTKFACKCADIV